MITAIIGRIRPVIALKRSFGRPEICARVMIGIPMEPKATGAVFPSRHNTAAWNGGNPRPASIAAETATGLPKPAEPSMSELNENAISSS